MIGRTLTNRLNRIRTRRQRRQERWQAFRNARLAIEGLEDRRLLAVTLDLTTAGAFGTVNGAVFSQTDFDQNSQGTGVINSFLRVQANGMEEGYNTDSDNFQFDEVGGGFTHSLMLSEVPIVIIQGEEFREFRGDINENSPNSELSLNELQIWLEATGDLDADNGFDPAPGAGFANAGNLVYDLDGDGMDNGVELDYDLNAGSGKGDFFVYIPNALFDAVEQATGNDFVYLYSKFGDPNATTDGFEEWSVRTPAINVGAIHGYKFVDVNNNGMDDDEPRLPGVQIFLDQNDNGVLDWTDAGDLDGMWDAGKGEQWIATDENGEYWFTNLVSGLGEDSTYIVREVEPADHMQTTDDPDPIELVDPGEVYVAFSDQEEILAGQTEFVVPELAFGNFPVPQPVDVSGTKFHDRNADGVWDPDGPNDMLGDADDEEPLSDWTINLDGRTRAAWR